jgi:hypothetical protein
VFRIVSKSLNSTIDQACLHYDFYSSWTRFFIERTMLAVLAAGRGTVSAPREQGNGWNPAHYRLDSPFSTHSRWVSGSAARPLDGILALDSRHRYSGCMIRSCYPEASWRSPSVLERGDDHHITRLPHPVSESIGKESATRLLFQLFGRPFWVSQSCGLGGTPLYIKNRSRYRISTRRTIPFAGWWGE